MNRDNYIVVQAWMVTELNLKGNELLVFACIHGFTQTEGQRFTGSLKYLAEWTNSTKQSVISCLKSLVEKGYLIRSDKDINGVKFVEYQSKKFNGGSQESLIGGSQESLPNNIVSDIQDEKDRNYREDIVRRESAFRKPTVEEVKAYCSERRNSVDAERFVDYYSSNGWRVGKSPMKDWKAAVRTWERNDNTEKRQNTFVPEDFDFKGAL